MFSMGFINPYVLFFYITHRLLTFIELRLCVVGLAAIVPVTIAILANCVSIFVTLLVLNTKS